MQSGRLLLLLLAMPVFAGSAGRAAQPGARANRPNILWIVAEDLGPELGSYGHPEAHTPHLDRLASQGVRYTRTFTVAPVCSVSRSALMTGMHAIAIDAHNHRSHRGEGENALPEGVRVLPQWLKEAGYYTANLGDDLEGVPGTRKDDFNFSVEGPVWDSDRWSDVVGHEPFYAQINLATTHRMGRRRGVAARVDRPADPDKVRTPPYYPDHAVTRKDWAEYLDAIQEMDAQVGRLLERLDADGLADRTVVVFIGDHGRTMLRGKQWPYDSGLHIPMIVRWPASFPTPEQIAPGKVDDRLLSALDLTATTLWAAGVERRERMQGRSFLGPEAVENEYLFASRDRCDETVLYDLRGDPWEIHNLADSPAPEHRRVKEELRAVLERWIEENDDPGQTPEPPELVDEIRARVEAFWATWTPPS